MMVTRYATTLESSIGLNEADLVRVAQKGDVEAFNQLVRFYQDRIFSLAARILGDEDSAEDITQNTFLTAYLNLPRFRNGSFRSWIYRIATNACYDELRRHKRYPVLSLEHEDDAEERLLPLYDFQGRGILPEKEAERHELEQAIQMALSQLDVDRRAAVVLVDLQELTYQEAAQVLGIPVGTVKSRLARGRLGLSQLLGTSSEINPST
jgi:RNA polymerase sigma-70 factor, ECF subfamily